MYFLIRDGKKFPEIAKGLCITKQRLQYYINFFDDSRIIKKIAYGNWELTKKGQDFEQVKEEVKKRSKKSSLGLRLTEKPTTNLHALQINFPILKGTINDKDWRIENKLNHWIPKYKGLENLGGLTMRNNNNKSLTVFAKSRDIESLEEVDNLAFKIKVYVYEYFKKEGVILDVMNCQTKNLNLATEDREAKGMLRKGEKFEFDLQKKAEKIFSKDQMDAKAWLDGSPFDFTAESNDKDWKREYLSMPFRIRDLFIIQKNTIEILNTAGERIDYLAENENTHIPLIKQLGEQTQKLANEVNRIADALDRIERPQKFPKQPKKPLKTGKYGLSDEEMNKIRNI